MKLVQLMEARSNGRCGVCAALLLPWPSEGDRSAERASRSAAAQRPRLRRLCARQRTKRRPKWRAVEAEAEAEAEDDGVWARAAAAARAEWRAALASPAAAGGDTPLQPAKGNGGQARAPGTRLTRAKNSGDTPTDRRCVSSHSAARRVGKRQDKVCPHFQHHHHHHLLLLVLVFLRELPSDDVTSCVSNIESRGAEPRG